MLSPQAAVALGAQTNSVCMRLRSVRRAMGQGMPEAGSSPGVCLGGKLVGMALVVLQSRVKQQAFCDQGETRLVWLVAATCLRRQSEQARESMLTFIHTVIRK